MDTNENTLTKAPEQIIELGVASIQTMGSGMKLDEVIGRSGDVGISE